MSERKVLNKYYPPDFDPSKIPRMKLPKNRQYTVRLMAPFNMRCTTCGEYIYRGKKFNAKKEDVEGEDYCGIRIYRFYIKCTRCLQEISFKTDPRNTDYEIEAGATRNFMALKLAQEQEKREEEELKEEEANNPMKLLENRTQQSKIEIEIMERLDEIKELNRRHYNIDFNELLKKYHTDDVQKKLKELQEERDNEIVKEIFAKKRKINEVDLDSDPISDDLKLPSSSGPPPAQCLNSSKSSPIERLNSGKPSPIERLNSSKPSSIERLNSSKPSPIERLKKSLAELKSTKNSIVEKPSTNEEQEPKKPQASALSLLGAYDSDSNNSE